MAELIKQSTKIKADGTKPKIIEEYIGIVNSKTNVISIAFMKSPSGWEEAGQQPEFDEYSIVLKGELRVRTQDEMIDVEAGQAFIAHCGEWVQYSTPGPEGAEYIAVCLPAFSEDRAHRYKD
jgi:mannose-6-phosphate isomerase-like protein (cupin superfamily)